MEIFIVFVIWLLVGAAAAYLAALRGRDPFLWSMGIFMLCLFGLPFAILGVALLYYLPAATEGEESADKEKNEAVSAPPVPVSLGDVPSRLWFYYDSERQRHGPLTFKDFFDAWKSRRIEDETFVWTESLSEWKKTKDLPELIEAFKKESGERGD